MWLADELFQKKKKKKKKKNGISYADDRVEMFYVLKGTTP